MISSAWTALLVVAAVAVLALVLRSRSGTEIVMPPRPDGSDPAGPDSDDDFDGSWNEGEAAAVTVDGLAFIGVAHGVHLAPMPEEDPLAGEPVRMHSTEFLRPGDFSAARIVRGSSEDPWRLELLGRDGEYVPFGFATEEAARCALELLEQREVMRYVRDDDGNPLRPSTEQYAEARRRHEETERALSMMDDDPMEPR